MLAGKYMLAPGRVDHVLGGLGPRLGQLYVSRDRSVISTALLLEQLLSLCIGFQAIIKAITTFDCTNIMQIPTTLSCHAERQTDIYHNITD